MQYRAIAAVLAFAATAGSAPAQQGQAQQGLGGPSMKFRGYWVFGTITSKMPSTVEIYSNQQSEAIYCVNPTTCRTVSYTRNANLFSFNPHGTYWVVLKLTGPDTLTGQWWFAKPTAKEPPNAIITMKRY